MERFGDVRAVESRELWGTVLHEGRGKSIRSFEGKLGRDREGGRHEAIGVGEVCDACLELSVKRQGLAWSVPAQLPAMTSTSDRGNSIHWEPYGQAALRS